MLCSIAYCSLLAHSSRAHYSVIVTHYSFITQLLVDRCLLLTQLLVAHSLLIGSLCTTRFASTSLFARLLVAPSSSCLLLAHCPLFTRSLLIFFAACLLICLLTRCYRLLLTFLANCSFTCLLLAVNFHCSMLAQLLCNQLLLLLTRCYCLQAAFLANFSFTCLLTRCFSLWTEPALCTACKVNFPNVCRQEFKKKNGKNISCQLIRQQTSIKNAET